MKETGEQLGNDNTTRENGSSAINPRDAQITVEMLKEELLNKDDNTKKKDTQKKKTQKNDIQNENSQDETESVKSEETEQYKYELTDNKRAKIQASRLRKTALAKAMIEYKSKPKTIGKTNEGDDSEGEVASKSKEDLEKEKHEAKIDKASNSPTKVQQKFNKASAIGGIATGGIGTVGSLLGASATISILDDNTKATDKNIQNLQKTSLIIGSISGILTCLLGMKKVYDAIKMVEKPSYGSVSKKIFTALPAFLGIVMDGIGAACSVSATVEKFDPKQIKHAQALNNVKNVNALAKQVMNATISFSGAMMHKVKLKQLSEATENADDKDPRDMALLGLKTKTAAAHKKDWIDFGKTIPSIILQATNTAYSWKDKKSQNSMISGAANGVLATALGGYNTGEAGYKMFQAKSNGKSKNTAQNGNSGASPSNLVLEKIDSLAQENNFVGSSHGDYENNANNISIEKAEENLIKNKDIEKDYEFVEAYLSGVDADIGVISKNSYSQKSFKKLVQLATGG